MNLVIDSINDDVVITDSETRKCNVDDVVRCCREKEYAKISLMMVNVGDEAVLAIFDCVCRDRLMTESSFHIFDVEQERRMKQKLCVSTVIEK
ncbi:hypothetical protein RYX36_008576, partial [Vicia faba]